MSAVSASPAVESVPAGLVFDPSEDPPRRRHLVLTMPWGATVDKDHDQQPGVVLESGDVVVDRALLSAGLSVNTNHDPRRKIGSIVDAAVDDAGVWAVVDLNEQGERVLAVRPR
ncbi:MAG: hypothetical protein GEV09_14315 [Pseudonocardiaceae bacterium]|nr:hypothetical protein [Pseudonocardiaceae bacterium]